MKTWYPLAVVIGLLAAGCAHRGPASENQPPAPSTVAQAKLKFAGLKKASGSVEFTQTATGVLVKADLKGLKKNSRHGFHIHEVGECRAPDFKSAGGHFNPTNQPHGDATSPARHLGDFGNVVADKKGQAHFEMTFEGVSLGGNNSITGKAIVLHAKADDGKTQPSGDSGERIACGVIEPQI